MKKYLPQEFESRWIERWDKEETYKTGERGKGKGERKKIYILDMFPYPSGAGLHVGHPRGYTATDILSRFHRMNDFAVLHPMGWDAFGLPAENAAIKAKKNPMDMVPKNIATFKRQMKNLGLSYDWRREFATTDPAYYKWTQWLFIQFYKMGLLYKKNVEVYYCEVCKTGLAEEEVLPNGTHERCGSPITKKELPQWIFKITSYADRLLEDLKGLDWPKGILDMQKNWIGRSEGVSFKEKVKDLNIEFEVFDTVPQTFLAQTFTVIAPEHPLVKKLVVGTKYEQPVMKFVEDIKKRKIANKFHVEKEKEGIFTGRYVDNPFGTGDLPIWVASYAILEYGTGIVNCSAHDERDFDFAKKYNIPLKTVMLPEDKELAEKVKSFEICYHHVPEGVIQTPVDFKGMTWEKAREPIIVYIEKHKIGRRQVHYHLRDWIFSRQRYWGEPTPMAYCTVCAKNKISFWDTEEGKSFQKDHQNISKANKETQEQLYGWFPIDEKNLPLELPYLKSYEPPGTGESPLALAKDWVKATCPNCGGEAKRETDTMPNWAGSCWYFIAFSFWNQEKASSKFKIQSSKLIENWKLEIRNYGKYWLPVDWYVGGAEHAVLHLLYARFWVKAIQDLGLIEFGEPFLRLRNVGIVLAQDHRKMSKSFGNVVNPDDVVKEYGADALRLYEMFMAPFSQEISWSTSALQGTYRFLSRIWNLVQNQFSTTSNDNAYSSSEPAESSGESRSVTNEQTNVQSKKLVQKLNKTIKKVTEDIKNIKFNTAIAAMMEFLNEWERFEILDRENIKKFLKILAPFAPFMTEELWREAMGEKSSIHLSSWPKVDEKILVEEERNIPIQINGKVRGVVVVSVDQLDEEKVVEKSLENERIRRFIGDKNYKVIYIKGKILNLVVKD